MNMSFEEMLKEFLEYPNYYKFCYNSFIYFSNGQKMGYWFSRNKDYILSSDDKICKEIVEQRKEYFKMLNDRHEERKNYDSNILSVEFMYLCNEFYDCKSHDKYNPNSNIKFNNGMLMGKWFDKNKDKIFNRKSDIYILVKKQYYEYLEEMKNKERIINVKKKQYFSLTKGYEKFSSFSEIKFFDGQKLSNWFIKNIDNILSSSEQRDLIIKKQYYEYCYFVELEEMFLKVDDEKFDEYGNRRFPTGALMYDWFVSNLNYIKNSGEEIDKEIMRQYNSYLDKNKTYKEEDKDLVKIKKY